MSSHGDLDHSVTVRIVALVVLGVVLVATIVGMVVISVSTDRVIEGADLLTFGGMVLLAGLGGVSWLSLTRRGRRGDDD